MRYNIHNKYIWINHFINNPFTHWINIYSTLVCQAFYLVHIYINIHTIIYLFFWYIYPSICIRKINNCMFSNTLYQTSSSYTWLVLILGFLFIQSICLHKSVPVKYFEINTVLKYILNFLWPGLIHSYPLYLLYTRIPWRYFGRFSRAL